VGDWGLILAMLAHCRLPSVIPPDTGSNQLLANLQAADRRRFARALELVRLPRGDVLAHSGQLQEYVYFPCGCLISVVVPVADAARVQVGLIGNEGFVGLSVLLGSEPGPQRLVCQIAGDAFRMPAERFRMLLRRTPHARQLLLKYAGVRLDEEAQNLACLALHSVGPRLARWLLVARDRVGSESISLTQESLAEMLGVRRPYLTRLMQAFRRDGHIRYQRGSINILSGVGLESAACQHYRALRARYAVLR
jgi:CRP-like cAMP-binding protein